MDIAAIGFKPTAQYVLRYVSGVIPLTVPVHLRRGYCRFLNTGRSRAHGEIVAALIDRKTTLKTFVRQRRQAFPQGGKPGNIRV